ncbi:hypothetical protein [Micromonospora sp. NBC_01796]|uniref:hypothetical protein n=1 Tax=Micromonospora sp. NBC_01796 TaxID=2975987 RepID=UPI002DD92454|nr:hypothetical protein [Micromonospora sp. NBC_01796]WSA86584.1 hypothetical protein OIE47_02875 [Micromonospora sp. NBC_01796]
MLRVGILVAALVGITAAPPLVGLTAAPAHAMAPTPVVAAPSKGTEVCVVTDERLIEISGMVATDDGYVVVNDSADLESRRKIFFLDRSCKVTRTVSYPSRPRDTEDVAMARDGTIWIADIGDNDRARTNIALWRLAKGAKAPVLHRLSYPDGAHDAEALLLAGDGTPIVVTKDPGTPRLYVPDGPLKAGATVRMRKAGEFVLPRTGTDNPWSAFGRLMVTGGATAPDGSRVVLRTYADAIEFDVTDGNVVEAVTRGVPRITPLPDEPQGESITYSRDGRLLLTVSETSDQPATTRPTVLGYTPEGRPAPAPTANATGPGSASTSESSASPASSRAQPSEGPDGAFVARLLGGLGLAMVALAVVGVLGVLAFRR